MKINKAELHQYESILFDENMLFELNAIPQMVVNKDRVIIRVNRKFTKLFGYTSGEILGHQTSLLTPSLEKFHEYQQYFTQTKEGVIKSEELEYKKKSGELFWVKLEGNPINQDRNNLFILWSFLDITKEVNLRMELLHANKRLQELADKDPMTKLFNRRYYNQKIKENFLIAQRYKTPLSLFMLDIDHFKKVNDTYGHAVGDEVIKAVASEMQKIVRKTDIPTRYGGEEFVIILPQTDLEDAFLVAKRLCGNIAKRELSFNLEKEVKFSVTVSIGVASFNKEDDSADKILQRADSALYAVKESGRNGVKKYSL